MAPSSDRNIELCLRQAGAEMSAEGWDLARFLTELAPRWRDRFDDTPRVLRDKRRGLGVELRQRSGSERVAIQAGRVMVSAEGAGIADLNAGASALIGELAAWRSLGLTRVLAVEVRARRDPSGAAGLQRALLGPAWQGTIGPANRLRLRIHQHRDVGGCPVDVRLEVSAGPLEEADDSAESLVIEQRYATLGRSVDAAAIATLLAAIAGDAAAVAARLPLPTGAAR